MAVAPPIVRTGVLAGSAPGPFAEVRQAPPQTGGRTAEAVEGTTGRGSSPADDGRATGISPAPSRAAGPVGSARGAVNHPVGIGAFAAPRAENTEGARCRRAGSSVPGGTSPDPAARRRVLVAPRPPHHR
ncbi:hypothetical protein [Streptomyces sp. NPDC059708]|uniref:hypothetical protein n=1 Tax=Streptomyces sp. NPDC059708 TaxID=3346916 RepID=UPI00369444EB